MSKIEHNPHLDDLRGAEQHHSLKDQPGEKGDPDHAKSDGTLPDDLAEAVSDGDAGTALGDKLKKAAG